MPALDAEHLWVSVAFLRGSGDPEAEAGGDRDAQIDRLVAFADERGWYDAELDAIRAHIEHLGD